MDISAMLLRISEILVTKNMKKEDFYALVPISDAAVSQWRKGKTKPSREKIRRMAEILGVTVEYLEYGIKKEPTSNRSELISSIIELFNQLTPEEAAKVLAYTQGVIDNRAD